MNIDKAKKRIAKHVKKGDKGYPIISITYFGEKIDCATEVSIQFTLHEGGDVMEERFASKTDAREDEVIQTTLLKVIERANANTVLEVEGVSIL
ncbi:hypothetical protein [Vibrio sp. F74]|uniref:hypothetical protein n=1 Tax=Vibrio sp. F74 TaxID=700020 RepID=UPI0035F5DAD1